MNEQKIAPVLSDDEISRMGETIRDAQYNEFCSWGQGYRRDSEGRFTIPLLPHILPRFARAVEQAVLARVGAVRDQRAIKRYYRGTDGMQQVESGDWVAYQDHIDAIRALKGTPDAAVAPIGDLSGLVEYLRAEADFNRSWTDGRRGSPASSEGYSARRLELAQRSDGWADDVARLIKIARHTSTQPAPAAAVVMAIDPAAAECGCSAYEQQHCRGSQSPYAQHSACVRAAPQPSGNPGPLAAVERAVLNLDRFKETSAEGGGVYETSDGDFVKLSEVVAAIAASKGDAS